MMTHSPPRIVIALLTLMVSGILLSACLTRTSTTAPVTPEPTQPEPTPTATVEPDDNDEEIPGKPERFQIDEIEVDAEVEHVEQDDQGRMDVPQEWENVAWYELGPRPGEQGNAVIAGHYDSFEGPAVFFDLNKIEEGDILRVITEDDEEIEFEVYEIESVHIDDADSRKIFGETDEYNLNLVTCEGVWDTATDMYDHRLIVYSRLVED
jgi:LPXTG-site transpeptidase (sortase) family protein